MRSTASALLTSLSFTCLGGCAAAGALDPPAAENAQSAEGRVGSHGMIVAGSPAQAFLSHIPMYGAPHDVQLVVAGAFSTIGGTSLPVSFSDRLYSFLPDRLSLDALRLGSLRELRGTLFLGNFEAGGRPLPSPVRFVVSRVVHQHVLDAAAAETDLGYLLFGCRADTFAVHRLAGAPSFDEVLRIRLGEDAPTDLDLTAGVEVVLQRRDEVAFRAGATSVLQNVSVGDRTFTFRSELTLSCLEGPDFTRPCADAAP